MQHHWQGAIGRPISSSDSHELGNDCESVLGLEGILTSHLGAYPFSFSAICLGGSRKPDVRDLLMGNNTRARKLANETTYIRAITWTAI